MTNSKNTVSKYTNASSLSAWDPTKWSSYTENTINGVSAYPVSVVDVQTITPYPANEQSPVSASLTPAKPPVQYMQVLITPPCKVSKIEIFNRTDCCQERISGLVVRTISPAQGSIQPRVVESVVLTGSDMKHVIKYNTNGSLNNYLSGADDSSLKANDGKLVATFYTDVNYTGTAVSLPIGDYPWIPNNGIPNDAVSSVKVPFGLKVVLYADGIGSNSLILTSNNWITSKSINPSANKIFYPIFTFDFMEYLI